MTGAERRQPRLASTSASHDRTTTISKGGPWNGRSG